MDDMKNVPFVVYESAMTRHERTIKKLIITIIICIVLLFASNIAWLGFFNQYEFSTTDTQSETVTVDGKDGVANYVGDDGDIVNGKDYSKKD